MSSKYTQRHYQDMAGILRDSRAAMSHSELAQLAGEVVTTYVQARMTALFAEDNPGFSQEKFARAARPSPGPPPALDFGEPDPHTRRLDLTHCPRVPGPHQHMAWSGECLGGTYVIRWSVEARDEYEARFTREQLEQAGVQVSDDGTVPWPGEIDPDELGLPDLETPGNLVSGKVSGRYVASAVPGEGFTPGEPVEYRYGGVGNPAIPYGSWVKGTFDHYVSGTPSVYVLNGLGHRALRLASQVRRPRS